MIRTERKLICDNCGRVGVLRQTNGRNLRRIARPQGWTYSGTKTNKDLCPGCSGQEVQPK